MISWEFFRVSLSVFVFCVYIMGFVCIGLWVSSMLYGPDLALLDSRAAAGEPDTESQRRLPHHGQCYRGRCEEKPPRPVHCFQ